MPLTATRFAQNLPRQSGGCARHFGSRAQGKSGYRYASSSAQQRNRISQLCLSIAIAILKFLWCGTTLPRIFDWCPASRTDTEQIAAAVEVAGVPCFKMILLISDGTSRMVRIYVRVLPGRYRLCRDGSSFKQQYESRIWLKFLPLLTRPWKAIASLLLLRS